MSPDKPYTDFNTRLFVAFKKMFKAEDFALFSQLSGDQNPLHTDVSYAKQTEYGRPIVPLHLSTLPLSAIAGMAFPGRRSLYLNTTIQAIAPIFYDEVLHYSARVISTSDAAQLLKVRTLIYQNATVLLHAEQQIKVREDFISDPMDKDDVSDDFSISYIEPTALITGATGELGRCIALALAKKGYHLLLQGYKNISGLQQLASQCQVFGVRTMIVQADLADSAGRAILAKAVSDENRLTHFIHTASAGVEEDAHRLMATNYLALKEIGNMLLPIFLRQQFGKIILLGSSAMQAYPSHWEDYVAAKSAAVSYVNGIAKQYQRYGIDAMTLAPDMMQTAFSKDFQKKDSLYLLPEEITEYLLHLLETDKVRGYHGYKRQGSQIGEYGFYSSVSMPTIESQQKVTSIAETSTTPTLSTQLDKLVKKFFALEPHLDLRGSHFEHYKNWDSLKHIQFLLALEDQFQISFDSSMIDQTQSFDAIVKLIENHLSIVHA